MAKLPDGSGDAYSNVVAGNGTQTATFTLPNTVLLDVSSVVATVTNGSASAVTPEVTVRDQAGVVIATTAQTSSIPAGDSGTATFARRLVVSTAGAVIGGGGVPGLLDQVDLPANFTVTATTQPTADVVMTGSSLVFDGNTTVGLTLAAEVFIDHRATPPGLSGGFGEIDLWDNGVLVGGVIEVSIAGGLWQGVQQRTLYVTPTAGSHQYSVRGWIGHGAGATDPIFTLRHEIFVGDGFFPTSFSVVQLNPLPT